MSQLFQAQPLVDPRDNESFALGASNVLPLTSNDLGKPLKLIASDTFGLCAAGDEIEGTLEAIAAFTVNNGFSFGTVNRRGRRIAVNGAVTATPFNDLVLAGPNAARNVKNSTGGFTDMVVQHGVPTKYLWRVISTLGGAGAQNSRVCIERI
jgi:hypothetical protein